MSVGAEEALRQVDLGCGGPHLVLGAPVEADDDELGAVLPGPAGIVEDGVPVADEVDRPRLVGRGGDAVGAVGVGDVPHGDPVGLVQAGQALGLAPGRPGVADAGGVEQVQGVAHPGEAVVEGVVAGGGAGVVAGEGEGVGDLVGGVEEGVVGEAGVAGVEGSLQVADGQVGFAHPGLDGCQHRGEVVDVGPGGVAVGDLGEGAVDEDVAAGGQGERARPAASADAPGSVLDTASATTPMTIRRTTTPVRWGHARRASGAERVRPASPGRAQPRGGQAAPMRYWSTTPWLTEWKARLIPASQASTTSVPWPAL